MINYDQDLLDCRQIDPRAPYPPLHQALRMALMQEYAARAFAAGVLAAFGQGAPFSAFAAQTEQRIARLAALCAHYGVPRPLDTYTVQAYSPSRLQTCQTAYQGALTTAAFYDYLVAQTSETDVGQAFQQLANEARNHQATAFAAAFQDALNQEQYHAAHGINAQQAYVKHGALSDWLEHLLAGMGKQGGWVGMAVPLVGKLPPNLLGGALAGAALTALIRHHRQQGEPEQ